MANRGWSGVASAVSAEELHGSTESAEDSRRYTGPATTRCRLPACVPSRTGYDGVMRVELVREFQFEAAHLLPKLPKSHKCRRLHGHSFRIEVHVEGECDPKLGWLIDYAEIAKAFDPLHSKLDHYYLNEIPGLENPTSENLARWIWVRLKPKLRMLSAVVVHETCNARAVYRGK